MQQLLGLGLNTPLPFSIYLWGSNAAITTFECGITLYRFADCKVQNYGYSTQIYRNMDDLTLKSGADLAGPQFALNKFLSPVLPTAGMKCASSTDY